MKSIKEALLSFLYPASCLHCRETLTLHSDLFCTSCATLLELIEADQRCPICFDDNYNSAGKHCRACKDQQQLIYRQAAAFEYVGPAATLIKQLKYSNKPYLSTGAGAFLAAQLLRLDWPMPDAIIPVPASWTHWLERGYNQSELLAVSMGQLLKIPVDHALKRKSGDYSQAGLSLEQRKALDGKTIYLRKGAAVADKTLLLIDDVYTSGMTINRCAEVLMEGCPARIYGLTFCRT